MSDAGGGGSSSQASIRERSRGGRDLSIASPRARLYAKDNKRISRKETMKTKPMKTVLHRADSRSHADHGWLDSHHTFSFANYYHPERIHFGVLRVLNDDLVAGGGGFPTHPHDNMEIVSIPLRGDLAHKDSMGNVQVIRQGDVQIMSAGTGVRHSEFNHSKSEAVNFLQIWILPKQRNIAPRYAQRSFAAEARQNRFQTVVSPDKNGDGQAVWINQDAWFSLGSFEAGFETGYKLKSPDHGLYVFVLEGELEVGQTQGFETSVETLGRRDGLGLWEGEEVTFKAKRAAEVLVMEVAMAL